MSYKPTLVIVGVNGTIGKHVLNALFSSTFKSLYSLPIRAITRDASKARELAPNTTDAELKFYTADIASGEGLDKAFEGADVVINLLGYSVSHSKVADAAAASKAKLYLPSEFGSDLNEAGAHKPLFTMRTSAVEYARSLGLKTVSIVTCGFSEWLLTVPPIAGVNFPEEGQFQYYGDIDVKFGTTSLVDVGKVVASVAAKDPSTLPNDVIVRGDSVSPRIVKEAYEKASGKMLKDVALPLEDITTPALKVVSEGIKGPHDFFIGLRGLLYSGGMEVTPTHNKFVSEGLFEFIPFQEVANTLLKK